MIARATFAVTAVTHLLRSYAVNDNCLNTVDSVVCPQNPNSVALLQGSKTVHNQKAVALAEQTKTGKSGKGNGIPLMTNDQAQSFQLVKKLAQEAQFKDFPPGCHIVFDVGCNDGLDAEFFLSRGFCVVSVDANPQMVQMAKERIAKRFAPNPLVRAKVHFANLGLGEKFGNLTFWQTDSTVHSSFNRYKALLHDPHATPHMVSTVTCDSLWGLANNQKPYYMKIDIEELHYVCIRSLPKVLQDRRPKYVSWEMHEFAFGLPSPILDVQLITELFQIGYTQMKIVSNIQKTKLGGFSSGEQMPDERIHVISNNNSWVSVKSVLESGVPDARLGAYSKMGDWWDYYMKLKD